MLGMTALWLLKLESIQRTNTSKYRQHGYKPMGKAHKDVWDFVWEDRWYCLLCINIIKGKHRKN
jgi:hypothetical protein